MLTVYKVSGKSLGPKPAKSWEEPFGRKWEHHVVAKDVTDAVKKIENHEKEYSLQGKLNNYHKIEYDDVPVEEVIVETLTAICPVTLGVNSVKFTR
jgi:hypothetical protein